MKKILFSLAALAALSMVAVGCKKSSDGAKDKTPSAKEVVGQKQEAFYQAIGDTSKTKCTKEEAEDIVKKYNELKDAAKALTGDDKTKFDAMVAKLDKLVTVEALTKTGGLTAVKNIVVVTPPVDKEAPKLADSNPVTVEKTAGTDKNKVITLEFNEKVKDPDKNKCTITKNCTATVAIASVAMDSSDASGKKVKITLNKSYGRRCNGYAARRLCDGYGRQQERGKVRFGLQETSLIYCALRKLKSFRC